MPFALLLSMQAAGMIVDYFGTRNQADVMKMGNKVEQAGINANIEATRLETEDATLQSLKSLRQNLGSQIAAFAARGTSAGAGSALTLMTESVSNFNADERIRRLNAMGKQNQLRAGSAISRLTHMSDTSKLWNSFGTRSLNRFPSTMKGWSEFGKAAKEGFGLTSIGS